MKTRKILSVLLAAAMTCAMCLSAGAVDVEGRPTTPQAYVGTEFVQAYDAPSTARTSHDKFLGSYTIQKYLNNGYMKFTDQSFGKADFPDDGVFRFETNLTTDGKKTTIKAGIAYVDWWGTDTFFTSTTMGLKDNKHFTTDKTPGKDTKYYGCIDNNTGGKVYGSFSIYAVYP